MPSDAASPAAPLRAASGGAGGGRRILLIDDRPAIHDDFRKILIQSPASTPLQQAQDELLGQGPAAAPAPVFEIDSAYQGEEGLGRVQEALAQGRPYALAFVDIRMPPGWDGVETIERIWGVDRDIQIVICTAFSDYSQQELQARLQRHEQFLILKKPFDSLEVHQMAVALTEKWQLQRHVRQALAQLEQSVDARTAELVQANRALENEVAEHQRARATLQRQQAELRVLFDLIPAMIWFKDVDHNILRVNRLGASTAGRTVAEVEGRSAFEIYPEKALEHHAADLAVMSSGVAQLGVVRVMRDRQGQQHWVQTDRVPYRDADGKVIGVVVMAQDVTERERREQHLHESEERMRATVDSALDCIVSIDADGRITEFNPAAERTFGFRRQEVIGRPMDELLIPPPWRAAHREGLRHLLSGGGSRLLGRRTEMPAMHADGSRILVELAVIRVGTGAGAVFTAFLRDITERRRAEAEISRANRSLKMLSSCNEALVHAQREQEMLEQICRIAVRIGGYRMAGVGYAMDDDARSILPMASFGDEGKILDHMSLSWAEDRPGGRGPAGQTIRTGKAVVLSDIAREPDIPWREAALQQGYRSLISLPLRNEQRTFGLLGLYSDEALKAGKEEVHLLQEMADNLAFGIASIRAGVERQRAHEARGIMERELAASLARQQSLSRRLVDVRELEQQNLSSELHDLIGQNLTALSFNINLIASLAPAAAAPKLAAALHDSRKLLEITIASVRNLITDLRPVALDDYGLLAGLRGYAEQVRARAGITVSVEGEEACPRLPPLAEAALFRIAQEALTNTVKHAGARRATVRLSCSASHVSLVVADDGIGFAAPRPEEPWLKTHWGLEMMRERAEALGAQLSIESEPGQGTRVTVTVERRA